METSVAQLEQLKPALPSSTRFCIVGGGPTGLSAAYALKELGYENVTVFEKHHEVGGMCETVQIEGKNYDLGGQVVARESSPTIKHFAQRAGVEMEDMAGHKLALVDCKTGEYENLKIVEDYVSIMQLTLELQAKAEATERHGVHALSSLAAEISSQFVSAKGMKGVPNAVAYGYTASGYGYPSEMPYAYLHEFARTSMFGKALRIKGGYTSLWQGIANLLPSVVCNTKVLEVERQDKIRVHVQNLETKQREWVEFDKIIMTGAMPIINPGGNLLTYSPKEMELFAKVQVIDYYTTVLKISGFDKYPVGFYYCKGYVDDPDTIGHPVAMQTFYKDTDVYLFWSYGGVHVNQEQMTRLLIQDVQNMGGTVQSIILQRRWNYFPHLNSQDMKSGVYDELEALQGQQNTYYAGGLFAFELTERNAAYATKLVARMFGTKDFRPSIKNLIDVPGKTYELEHLTEREGVEFPDLPNLDSYLRFYARHSVLKDTVLYTWLDEKGEETDKRTYAELDKRADIVAKNLRACRLGLVDGDQLVLLYMPGLEFIEAFFGCIRAKILPVPLIPPDVRQGESSHALAKVENVAKVCEAKGILSTVAYHTAVRASGIRNMITKTMLLSSPSSKQTSSWPKLPWLHTDSWTKDEKVFEPEFHENHQPQTSQSESCFLQFTSGSTGDAKGVIITHSGLIHNVKLMRTRYKSTSQTVLVSWLPQYHDMGLIGGLFTALVSGGTAILFSPTSFVRRPLLWLETMSKYGATHSAGPNFAFELVAKRLEMLTFKGGQWSFDLSRLKFLMASAEPVRASTLQKFLKLLEGSGLKEQVLAPGYGLAENCVFVTVAWGHEKPLVVDHQGKVCCGLVHRGDKDVDIRIVDPESCQETDEGVEGEVWVRSPSTGSGYWCLPELSHTTFEACVAGGNDDETFLRTGDLGRVIQGMLFMTGRIKELIIVRGQNIYPSDIEKTVETCSDALRPGCCAAFGAPPSVLKSKGISVDGASEDVGIVVVAEVRDEKKVDPEVLTSQIASTVASEHGVSVVSVSLIKPRTISKTSSGKIRRLECLKEFAEDRLENIHPNWERKKKILTLRKSRTFSGRSYNSLPSTPEKMPVLLPPPARKTAEDVTKFLVATVGERLDIPEKDIMTSRSFADYGMDSTATVWAAQKLSSFLGTHIAAVDIYTAGCITELAEVATDLMAKQAGASSVVVQQSATSLEHPTYGPSKEEIQQFIIQIISEKTGIATDKLSLSKSFAEFGLDSVAVVWASQKLSNYLGIHVAAINIYTAGHISELCDVVHDLLKKEKPTQKIQLNETRSFPEPENDDFESELVSDSQFEAGLHPSLPRQAGVSLLQMLGVTYVAAILLLPAMVILSKVNRIIATYSTSWFLISTILVVPAAWLVYLATTALTVALSTVTQPNLYLKSTLPLWSVDFVRWWTNYRLQDFISSNLAVHLRGTVFFNWWYRLLGARIGHGVQLDTIDITDPSLLILADGAVVAEGATLQSHEVKDGVVQFKVIRIGRGVTVGPYSYIGMGTTLKANSVSALGKMDGFVRQGLELQTLQSWEHKNTSPLFALWHIFGLYIVSLAAATSAALSFVVYILLASKLDVSYSTAHWRTGFLIFTSIGVFPWAVSAAIILGVVQDPTMLFTAMRGILGNGTLLPYLFCVAVAYVTYGVTLSFITWALKWTLIGKLDEKPFLKGTSSLGYRVWLVHRLLVAAHMKFTKFLSGTEIACVYLRSLGAKIGHMASIRGVNVILDPDLLELGKSSHLGDFAKVVTSVCSGKQQSTSGKICIGDQCIVGAQSVVMPGATMEDKSWLGAMSLAGQGTTLKQGGVYVGAESLVMIYKHVQDEEKDSRLEVMDPAYRKVVANLSAHIAKTSHSVNSRYFHRAGVSAKGTMTMLKDFVGVPDHDFFLPGQSYTVVVRHSNSLSSDDDARPDARGASLRILRDGTEEALLDLTLKTGKAFYARTILDFVTWLTKGISYREEVVSRKPHIGDAVWDSLRLGRSYAEMHYYSNVCRLFRSTSGEEWFVKFRLRPIDTKFTMDEGRIQREGILPPDTGALPRREQDKDMPREFMRSDFSNRVTSAEGVKYLFQIQLHTVPTSANEREDVLDCTKPWDEGLCPYRDVAVIHFNELLDSTYTERIRFNPRNGVPSIDIIPATSMEESASIDHGRSVAYDIAQYVRTGRPLPPAWETLLKEADVITGLVDHKGSACPAAAALLPENISIKPVSSQERGDEHQIQSFSLMLVRSCIQPIMQVTLPVMFLAFSLFFTIFPATYLATKLQGGTTVMIGLVPIVYMASAVVFASLSVLAKRVFLGEATKPNSIGTAANEGEASSSSNNNSNSSDLWGWRNVKDTSWQAINLTLNEYFMDLLKGSVMSIWYLRALGASIGEPTYMDSNLALNPELLTVGSGSWIGRNALLFGHLYERGQVQFGSNVVGDFAFVGARSLMLPGSKTEDGSQLPPLTLVMKNEVLKAY